VGELGETGRKMEAKYLLKASAFLKKGPGFHSLMIQPLFINVVFYKAGQNQTPKVH
jgi:hypothetical protein